MEQIHLRNVLKDEQELDGDEGISTDKVARTKHRGVKQQA